MTRLSGTRLREAQLRALRSQVENELRHIPQLRGVGVGLRRRAGRLTGEICFRIHVDQKRPAVALHRNERIPSHIFGIPTDVHTLGRMTQQCCGGQRPLIAGLAISHDPSVSAPEGGTLGCFLDIGGTLAGLTNEHVLHSKSLTNKGVYQPKAKSGNGTANRIGFSNPSRGFINHHVFGGNNYFIDCAVVEFENVDFVNRLVRFDPSDSGADPVDIPADVTGTITINEDGQILEITDGTNAVDTTKILGQGVAQLKDMIWKVGAVTGLTAGVVEEVDFTYTFTHKNPVPNAPTPWDGEGQIVVSALAGFRDEETNLLDFSRQGDSGSVYLNLQNEVVGLHHTGTSGLAGSQGVASPIAPVLDKVGGGATIIVNDGSVTHETSAESNLMALELWANTPQHAFEFERLEREIRPRLAKSERGAEILRFVDSHVDEILRLVWQCRPVTIAWHRHHGPAFVVLFIRALAEHGGSFPEKAGDISRRSMLNAMAEVLATQGSPALRRDVTSIRPWLLDVLGNCRDFNELCAGLARVAA